MRQPAARSGEQEELDFFIQGKMRRLGSVLTNYISKFIRIHAVLLVGSLPAAS